MILSIAAFERIGNCFSFCFGLIDAEDDLPELMRARQMLKRVNRIAEREDAVDNRP